MISCFPLANTVVAQHQWTSLICTLVFFFSYWLLFFLTGFSFSKGTHGGRNLHGRIWLTSFFFMEIHEHKYCIFQVCRILLIKPAVSARKLMIRGGVPVENCGMGQTLVIPFIGSLLAVRQLLTETRYLRLRFPPSVRIALFFSHSLH